MALPDGLKFSKSHEWVKVDGEVVTVGITAHAADELGDIALVLLPEIGRVFGANEQFGEIESLKAVSDLYVPVGGTVVAVNDSLTDAPQHVNDSPFGDGWIIKLQMSDPEELNLLLNAAAYDALVQEA